MTVSCLLGGLKPRQSGRVLSNVWCCGEMSYRVMRTLCQNSSIPLLVMLSAGDRFLFLIVVPQRSKNETGAGWGDPFLFPLEYFQSRGSVRSVLVYRYHRWMCFRKQFPEAAWHFSSVWPGTMAVLVLSKSKKSKDKGQTTGTGIKETLPLRNK